MNLIVSSATPPNPPSFGNISVGGGNLLMSGTGGAVLNRVIGGWVINGIYSYETGGPVGNWGDVIYLGGDLNYQPTNVDHTFNTAAFNTNSAQQLSNHVRTFPTRFPKLRHIRCRVGPASFRFWWRKIIL